jgi:hypothetical protein
LKCHAKVVKIQHVRQPEDLHHRKGAARVLEQGMAVNSFNIFSSYTVIEIILYTKQGQAPEFVLGLLKISAYRLDLHI